MIKFISDHEEQILFGFLGVVLLVCLAFVIWAICSYTPLTEGFVIDKDYDPAHRVYRPIHIYSGGHNQSIPHWRTVGDRWTVWIQNGEDKDMWYVTEEFYNSVHVGDWVKK